MKYKLDKNKLIIEVTDKQINEIKEGYIPILTFCRFSDVPQYDVEKYKKESK